jgi:dolichol-phosphate mannosyltransferase
LSGDLNNTTKALDRPAEIELTVVVPTRNERDNILPLLERLERSLDGIEWEIVFVDDDSPDGTADLVRSIARTNPCVRCIQRIGRRGLSSACIEGVLSSAAPFAAVIDADLQHDERLFPRMLDLIKTEDLDVVVGSRYCEGGSLGEWAKSREKISQFATKLARMLVRNDLSDPMSGFFLIRRAAFDKAVRHLSGRGFKILLDLFASAPEPLRFKELPYQFGERHSGESKLDAAIALEYINLLLDKTVGRFVPVRFILFALVGATGILVHMAALTLAFTVLSFTYAKLLATIIAMTSNFALNNALTYRDMRLRGAALVRGLLSFYIICGLGAAADVGIASILFHRQGTSWWLAGLAGILIGSVWNYAMASVFTWRSTNA